MRLGRSRDSRTRSAARAIALLAFLALPGLLPGASLGCSRVSEQALRDEQARSRMYRDAYETQAAELAALKAKLAAGAKICPAASPVPTSTESGAATKQ